MPFWEWMPGFGPLVGAAIHDGHALRTELRERILLGEAERLREEDPFTAAWAGRLTPHFRVHHSRFEVDLNRPRESAIYLKPEDCWGLRVWRKSPSEASRAMSLRAYDEFYSGVERRLREVEACHRRFVVLDIHSYNHRRAGPDQPPADPLKNPEINVGTASCQRELWGPLIDRFIGDLRAFDFRGRRLDVRENVKFLGGHFPQWVNAKFSGSGAAIALEFKKTFMDEWEGELDAELHGALGDALASTFAGLRESLRALGGIL